MKKILSSSELSDVIDTAKAGSLTLSKITKQSKPLSNEVKTKLDKKVKSILTQASNGKISPEKAVGQLKKAYQNAITDNFKGNIKAICKKNGSSPKKALDNLKSHFKSTFFESAGELLPKTSKREFHVNGEEFHEQLEIISCDSGSSYLRQVQGDKKEYQTQINFIDRSKDPSTTASRPSGMKKETRAQGMAINANKHTVKDSDGTSRTIIRAGAPAVHGQGKLVLAPFKEKYSEITKMESKEQEKELLKLKDKLKSDQPLTLEKLQDVIQERTHLVTAQALPTILASLENLAQDPKALQMAQATGSFLHIERSNVSDLDSGEAAMMEDMKGAMDELSANVKIVFSNEVPDNQPQVNNELEKLSLPLNLQKDQKYLQVNSI